MKSLEHIALGNNAFLFINEIGIDSDEMISHLENFDEYQVEFEKINTEKRKREFLAARILINEILRKPVKIAYDSAGKPFLINMLGCISISHSANFIAVMYHPEKLVGVDIECPTDRVLKVAERFLNKTELSYLGGNLLKIQLAWSVKEAVYKIVGNEVVDFADGLCVLDFEPTESTEIRCSQPSSGTIFSLNYKVTNQYNLVYSIF